ncbi:sugar phosphate isomerase/epimerase family protein [Rhizobium binxianense]|uniref:sugar phosphate isomerase/epimerase family protein n=1 Tax=Rhizobium binxianense TaxID=3024242 RepID=UPI00235F5F9A|nr:sugar phosphate isomerase/epimerase [Rhizobium sp. MC62]MDC9813108.1 sugar phosphate isomerase/epimerase [Rhizobium sp. MC62]
MDVSFQLYSANNFADWPKIFKTVAGLGYTQVEGYGAIYEDPQATRALLDENGLQMPSGHFALDLLSNDTDKAIAIATELGMQRIYCPWIAPADRSADSADWKNLGERLEAIGTKVKAAGFAFGWHNHDFEFVKCTDGTMPMDMLLRSAPSIDWEADIAWIVRGKQDPLKWIEAYKDRITAVHVKDLAPEGENQNEGGWADLGHGTVDWRTILAALRKNGVNLFVLEHDKPSDIDRFASRSIASFKAL